jgi:hypothetical protein
MTPTNTPEMDQVTSVELSHRRHDLAGKGATKKTRELHVGSSCSTQAANVEQKNQSTQIIVN